MAHTRSLAAVPRAATYCPGSQSLHFSHVDWSPSCVKARNVPAAQGAQTASAVLVAAVTRNVPAPQRLGSSQRGWFSDACQRPSGHAQELRGLAETRTGTRYALRKTSKFRKKDWQRGAEVRGLETEQNM